MTTPDDDAAVDCHGGDFGRSAGPLRRDQSRAEARVPVSTRGENAQPVRVRPKGTVFRGTSGAAGVYAHGTVNPELAAYHAEMRRKYENAAARPWLAIEPDLLPP